MQNTERTKATLAGIKSLGVRIALDDFGTGYSSLTSLRRFPIDSLKIDTTFVRDIGTERDDVSIAAGIIGLGHKLRLGRDRRGRRDRGATGLSLQGRL